MKKNIRLVLALVLALSLFASMSAMAATITITAPTGHTYEVYQIFRGTVDANDSSKLNDLVYGKNAATGAEGEPVSIADITDLAALAKASYADDQAKIAAYEKFVEFSNPIATVASATATSSLDAGWYVIKDKDNTVPDHEGATLYMFKVLGSDFATSAKSDKPSAEKKVQDINDTTDTAAGDLQDSADWDVGDLIPYTLTFTLPSDYANYKTYYVNFKDTLSTGLTLNPESVKIFFGTGDTTGTAITFSGTNPYTYAINDLKTDSRTSSLGAGDVIKITYTAYLNENAVIGGAGNENKYTVEFTRNPNQSSGGTPDNGETPEDVNVVFTYKTVFDKVDQDGKSLAGADFKLEKKVGNNWVDVTTLGTSAHPSKIGDSASKSTSFEFKGLDDGTYRLTEIYTPEGYNTIDPITFDIVASHVANGVDLSELVLQSLAATNGLNVTGDTLTGKIETSVENKSGVVLPSTGGIGTTIFYVAGSILVLAAAILLITKRRMGAND